jgi:hypothetical protein
LTSHGELTSTPGHSNTSRQYSFPTHAKTSGNWSWMMGRATTSGNGTPRWLSTLLNVSDDEVKATVLALAGAYLFIADVRANGLKSAAKGVVANAALRKGFQAAGGQLGMRAPTGLWTGLGLSVLGS